MEQCICVKFCNKTEIYNLLQAVLDDDALRQSTMFNGANISKVFENTGKMNTVLTAHWCCWWKINAVNTLANSDWWFAVLEMKENVRISVASCFSILTKNVEMQQVSTQVIPQFPMVEQIVNRLNPRTDLMLFILCLILIFDYLPRSSATSWSTR